MDIYTPSLQTSVICQQPEETFILQFLPKFLRNAQELKDSTDRLSRNLDAAIALADPAERLYGVLNAKSDAKRFSWLVADAIGDRADGLAGGFYMTCTIGGVLAGAAVATTLAPVAGAALMAVGLVVGIGSAVTGSVDSFFRGKFFDKVRDYVSASWDTQTRADKEIRSVLETSSREIAASPAFGKIYDAFPEIRDHFIKTFNQSAARKELDAASVLKAQAAPPPAPAI